LFNARINRVKEIPFYSNTKDDSHCVQAVFRLALEYFLPDQKFSWSRLDKITHKQVGKGTWWFPAVFEITALGLTFQYIEAFDYQSTIAKAKII